jgi:hypothetical protein
MHAQSSDQGFDSFRRERKRLQSKIGTGNRVLGYENETLRELEAVEQREVRDQQLTREVHEFFASATKQAATIVERVAKDAQVEAGQRIEQEMESFLIDALARMNSFVVAVLHQRRAPVADQQMEPKVGNLVGQLLDEFRWAGTAEVGDKHIGQDPFAIDVDDVRREFKAVAAEAAAAKEGAPSPIEEHLVADVAPPSAETAESAAPPPPAPARVADAGPAETPREDLGPTPQEELERFKAALKSLVKQGTMTREEARAAWQTRLQSLGLLPA